jgi:hypothetical protein
MGGFVPGGTSQYDARQLTPTVDHLGAATAMGRRYFGLGQSEQDIRYLWGYAKGSDLPRSFLFRLFDRAPSCTLARSPRRSPALKGPPVDVQCGVDIRRAVSVASNGITVIITVPFPNRAWFGNRMGYCI